MEIILPRIIKNLTKMQINIIKRFSKIKINNILDRKI